MAFSAGHAFVKYIGLQSQRGSGLGCNSEAHISFFVEDISDHF